MTHGRAYKVSKKDVRGYRHTDPPVRRVRAQSYRPNPIGVTTLAAINGRGAYSAREAMRGASDRYGVARRAVRGDEMPLRRNPPKRAPTAREQRAFGAGFGRVFKKKTTKRASSSKKKPTPPPPRISKKAEAERKQKRETAYRRAMKAGYGKEAAARRAMRVQPFLKSQKGKTFKGVSAYTGKATKKPLPKQYAKKTVKVTKKVTKKVPKKRNVRVAYGKYKRLKVTDPRTGNKKRSYLYKTKAGKRRKIPSYAIGGASSPKTWKDPKYKKAKKRIKKRRSTAAKRVTSRGGPFTPNRRRKRQTMRKNPSTKRSRAAKKAWKTRRAKAAARSRSAKKGAKRRSYRRNPTRRRKATTAARSTRKAATPNRRRRRTTKRRTSAKRATPNRRRRVTARRTTKKRAAPKRRRTTLRRNRKSTQRKDPKRVAAGKKAARTRKRRRSAGLSRGKGTPGRYLKRGKIYYRGRKPKRLRGVKARKLPKSRIYVTNRRRKATRRRPMRRNQFMASLKTAATSALFVTSGFIGHKALVHGISDKLLVPQLEKMLSSNGNGNGNGQAVRTAVPIVTGGLMALTGTWLTSKVVSRQRTVEIGAGMFTSWIHTVVVKLLDMSESTRPALPFVSGYDTSSTAAAIGRYRRRRGVRGVRGMRGLGAGPTTSILPHYAPAEGHRAGGMRQAVAGRRGTGEYFATSGMGEYFASGVQGVGQYEPAGPMVTQAAAGLGQQIDNGIMPDQADDALTLAEAQAGTGGLRGTRGMGEYYSAKPHNGSWQEYRVPTSSTWVPGSSDAPLWAGTKPAEDSLQTSEIPAGSLESASGNGIF